MFGEIDQRRDEVRIVVQRAAIGLRGFFHMVRRPIVEQRPHQEVAFRRRQVAHWRQVRQDSIVPAVFAERGLSSMIRAGCASRRKSNAS